MARSVAAMILLTLPLLASAQTSRVGGVGIQSDYLGRRSPVGALSSPAGPMSGEPHLAVGPQGEVWLSWLEGRPRGGHALKAARLEGNRWSRPLTIASGDSFFVNWADFPSILPLGGSKLAAHWAWKSGADVYAYDVRLSFSEDGGRTWSAPVIPHQDRTPTEHGFVSVVAEGANVRVVWLDGRDFAKPDAGKSVGSGHDRGAAHGEAEGDHEMALRTAVIRANGTVAGEAVLDPRVCDCCQTAAVRIGEGVLVAYRDRSKEEIRDISIARLDGGRWSAPRPLHRDGWSINGCPVNGPALDALGDRVAAAWFTAAAESAQVWLAFSDDGGRSFGAPHRIHGGRPFGRVDVALAEDGAALVLWLEEAGKGARIQLRRVSRAGAAEPPLTIARTSSARASGFPRMVRSGNRLVLAWTESGKPARVRTAIARLK